MPDDLDPTPVPPPEAPSNVAELLPFLPVSYEYGQQWGMVFSTELADILAEYEPVSVSFRKNSPKLPQ